MTKTTGSTWWRDEWLKALHQIDASNRISKGRIYAQRGLVYDLNIKANRINALVFDKNQSQYAVQLSFKKFSTIEKNKIIQALNNDLVVASRVLISRLPKAILPLLKEIDVSLFPKTLEDLNGDCPCEEKKNPCRHQSAVLHQIAYEIEKDPFLVFRLRGFSLLEEWSQKGLNNRTQGESNIQHIQELQQAYSFVKTKTVWDDEVFQQIDFSRLPDCGESLLTILSSHPDFYPQGDFKKVVQLGYASVSKALLNHEKNNLRLEEDTQLQQIEDIEILTTGDFNFLNATFRDKKGESILVFESLEKLMAYLDAMPLKDFNNYSNSLKSLALVYRFAFKLLIRSACVPQLLMITPRQFKIRWIPALLNPEIKSVFDGVNAIFQKDLLYYKNETDIYEPIESDSLIALLSLFINELIQQHHGLNFRFAEHPVGHLFFNGKSLTLQSQNHETKPEAIQLWLSNFFISQKELFPIFQIDEQEKSFALSIAVQKKSSHLLAPIPLSDIFEQDHFTDLRINVLQTLAQITEFFPPLDEILLTRGQQPLIFDSKSFATILFHIIPTIRLFGIKVLLPKSLRKLLRPRISIKIKPKEEQEKEKKKSVIGLSAMLGFDWKIAIGDQHFSKKEILEMIAEYSGIVKVKDQYVVLNEEEIRLLVQQLKHPPKLRAIDILHASFTETYQGAKVQLDNKIRTLRNEWLTAEPIAAPKGLQANLRPYQLAGFRWLYKNTRLGFGSLLADDMGLGKTLQVISLILKLKEQGDLQEQKVLVIVPTTLLTNWSREIRKFAPDLTASIYHGTGRDFEQARASEVLITTYGISRSEANIFQNIKWLLVVIDEAQNIKNPEAAQTTAIKKIPAQVHIAMSGTPVENRLSEYWSVFDFANKGYLGSLTQFKDTYAKPIELDRNQEQLNHFRKITAPFILRRLKSDPSIIQDLPDKIELDQYCSLSAEQTAIYQNVINNALQAIARAKGIDRKGLVLKLLTSLKQICNHPVQYLKKGLATPEQSGKMLLLFELIRQILETGGKTLIFTQYQEMGKLLSQMLGQYFDLEVPFLHGGLSRKARDQMVEIFQEQRTSKILILSLKAAGTGLNLTAASNVIHYDLWWNPAAEAQATDRAYRIGQQKNVMVHRLICQGTFEERINQLLLQKKELADLTVFTGEKWIGDFSDEELSSLVKLD